MGLRAGLCVFNLENSLEQTLEERQPAGEQCAHCTEQLQILQRESVSGWGIQSAGLGGSEEGQFFQSPRGQSVNILKLLPEGLEKLTLKRSYFLRKFLGLLLYCTTDSRVKGCRLLVAESNQWMSVSEAMSPFC